MTRQVLVVDDEDDVRMVVQLTLEALGGFEVVSASSGEEALVLAQDSRPDAILLDVMMPGVDGPATVRLLRGCDRTRDIPVVLLTARGRQTDRDELASLAVQGILTKPFDPRTLATDLSSLLGWGAGT